MGRRRHAIVRVIQGRHVLEHVCDSATYLGPFVCCEDGVCSQIPRSTRGRLDRVPFAVEPKDKPVEAVCPLGRRDPEEHVGPRGGRGGYTTPAPSCFTGYELGTKQI